MTNLIFLDIDGVLNTHDFCSFAMCGLIHRDKIDRLNKILVATDAKIVLSSAWRYIVHRGEATLMGIDWLLRSHGLHKNRLLGITRLDTTINHPNDWKGDWSTWVVANERGKQIKDWIRESGEEYNYIAIDDLDLGITEEGVRLIKTDSKVGLQDSHIEEAIRLLEG